MKYLHLETLGLPSANRQELDALPPEELADRMDLFFQRVNQEIYLLDLPRTGFASKELVHTASFEKLKPENKNEALWLVFEMNFSLEAAFRALGCTNTYVHDSKARQVNGWNSPSVQVMANATQLWCAASVRALLDKFTILIYLLDENRIVSD